jgi:hypothetical protein
MTYNSYMEKNPMTNQHPITPPPELVQQWVAEIWHEGTPVQVALSDEHIAARATQWGADQELEACCEWLRTESKTALWQTEALRAARRPKPPSLKEQAQAELKRLIALIPTEGAMAMAEPIRRALEALPE